MIKLISINVETDMHHERVVSFVQKEKPDVLCMQEVFEIDIAMYEKEFGMKSFFKPMSVHPSIKNKGLTKHVVGLAIFTQPDVAVDFNFHYYVGAEHPVLNWEKSLDLRNAPHLQSQLVLVSDIDIAGEFYRIATTHLPVTFEGISEAYQIKEAEDLLQYLSQYEDLVLCGDFNAPRGKETFSLFQEKYMDNIPAHHNSSIDPLLHKARGLELMVDGLFSTDSYTVTEVQLKEGVSDHKAIVGFISPSA